MQGADPAEVCRVCGGVGPAVEEHVCPCVAEMTGGAGDGVGRGPWDITTRADRVVAGGGAKAVGVVGVEAVRGRKVQDGGGDQAVLTDSCRLHGR